METLHVGSIVEGKVLKVGRSGMRVELPGGQFGWVPVQQMAAPTQALREDALFRIAESLQDGQTVTTKGAITSVRIAESKAQAQYQLSPLRLARDEALAELRLGQIYRARIVEMLDGRMVVQLNEYLFGRLAHKHMVGSEGEVQVRLLNHIEGVDCLDVALIEKPIPGGKGTLLIRVSEKLAERINAGLPTQLPKIGEWVVSTVKRLKSGDVRVDLPNGIEGLVKDLGTVKREHLQIGQRLRVKIIAVHPGTTRVTVVR